MKIRVIIPGKEKKDFISDGISEYILKIKRFSKIDLEYVEEEKVSSNNLKEIDNALLLDAKKILKKINDQEYVILVDIHAKDITTSDLAIKFNNIISSNGNIVLILGSSNGISDILRKRANFSFSLSKLTFTHYMSLLLTLEQIYRCFKILNNETYDK